VEVFIALLARAGRPAEAFQAAAELLRPDMRTSGFAPGLVELASQAGCYDRLMTASRDRDDALGFTAGLIEGARN
jgi:hypothetical protein